jgi:N-acetylmuramic acid 6-phosphate (MurNAc-6-P) etherase
MARRTYVPKWPNEKTVYDIALRMETTPEALIINPIIGPEPISGSSRMKGGSATKVILDTVFYLASTNTNLKSSDVINEFKATVDRMEIEGQDLATVVEQAGEW